MPMDDSSEFEVNLTLPEGSGLEQTAALTAEVEAQLKAIRIGDQVAITDTLVTVGPVSGRVGKGEGDVTQANIYCRLPELGGLMEQLRGKSRSWGQLEAMGKARGVVARYPDVRSWVAAISTLGGGGVRTP